MNLPRPVFFVVLVVVVLAILPPATGLGQPQALRPVDRTAAINAIPYDLGPAEALLRASLPAFDGRVAVIVRQGGRDIFRFQAGEIDFDTRNRLASFTKTISAGVILALRDEGFLSLDERIGDTFPFFDDNGIGDPTIEDAWAMRHGIETPVPYQRDPRYTLAQSVLLTGSTGSPVFPPGSRLGYDGIAMQVVGQIAVQRAGLEWEDVARTRIFERYDMPDADYRQFDPNPAVAGGLRSSAIETIAYAQMILDRGWYAGQRVLSDVSIEQLFTNETRGLPVHHSPWPASNPLYPYGVDPDYGFGAWILAENPDSLHVEEIVGAGAWGSYVWIDRRRGLTAVLITDILPGTQTSMDPALGLFAILRRATESAQTVALEAEPSGSRMRVTWRPAPGSTSTLLYGSATPIRDVFDLRDATFLGRRASDRGLVPVFAHYAATADFGVLENSALVPEQNSVAAPAVR